MMHDPTGPGPPPERPSGGEEMAESLLKAIWDTAGRDRDGARALLARLRALAETYTGEPALRELLAGGLTRLIWVTADDDVAGARQLLDRLRILVEGHPDEPALFELWAANATRLAVGDAQAGRRAAARATYRELAQAVHNRAAATGAGSWAAAREGLVKAGLAADSAARQELENDVRAVARHLGVGEDIDAVHRRIFAPQEHDEPG